MTTLASPTRTTPVRCAMAAPHSGHRAQACRHSSCNVSGKHERSWESRRAP